MCSHDILIQYMVIFSALSACCVFVSFYVSDDFINNMNEISQIGVQTHYDWHPDDFNIKNITHCSIPVLRIQ